MRKIGSDATDLKVYREEWDDVSITSEWDAELSRFLYYFNVDKKVLAITDNQIYANAIYDCQCAGYERNGG